MSRRSAVYNTCTRDQAAYHRRRPAFEHSTPLYLVARMRLLVISAMLAAVVAMPQDQKSSSYSSSSSQQHEAVYDEQQKTQQQLLTDPAEAAGELTDDQLLAALGVGVDQDVVSRCEGEQHVCVPYYLCSEGAIITDGAGLIDIRFGSNKDQQDQDTAALSHSECANYLDVCCAAPVERENTTESSYEPQCGRRHQEGVNARIVGFKDGQTQFGEFPWMAAVLRREQIDGEEKNLYVCGGALIHPQVVMTAAHCVQTLPAEATRVRLGEWDTTSTSEFLPHQDVDIAATVWHPDFNYQNLYNDIGLLFLSEPVELQEHIDTLCLPDPAEDLDWSQCVATGWGKDRFNNGSFQTVLKQVDLTRVNSSSCQQSLRTTRLGQHFRLHDSFTCAGAPPQQLSEVQYDGAQPEQEQLVADTCTGDGGSPLACVSPSSPDRYVHGGLVAWGIGCGEKEIPGVYADPSRFVSWIDAQVSEYFQLEQSYWGHGPTQPAETATEQPEQPDSQYQQPQHQLVQ